jgi:hypothetical protein
MARRKAQTYGIRDPSTGPRRRLSARHSGDYSATGRAFELVIALK